MIRIRKIDRKVVLASVHDSIQFNSIRFNTSDSTHPTPKLPPSSIFGTCNVIKCSNLSRTILCSETMSNVAETARATFSLVADVADALKSFDASDNLLYGKRDEYIFFFSSTLATLEFNNSIACVSLSFLNCCRRGGKVMSRGKT